MYSVEEVAKKLNVSKVTIYAKLKKHESKVIMNHGKKYISQELLNLIYSELSLKNKSYFDEVALTKDNGGGELKENLFNELVKQLGVKDIQIKEKDKQIEELINLNKNNQILLKQQQDKEINHKLLEDHFREVDEKLMDLRERMDEKKKSKKKFGFFSK